jgi:hypothetical protein
MGNPLTRTKKKSRFLKIECEWFNSSAFRDLTPVAVCLLLEFLNVYYPSRNGRLSISTRDASKKIGVSENTCIKAFHDLVEHGFLILTNHHNWTQGKAREFELTVKPLEGRVAKNSWNRWEPGKPVGELPKRKKPRPQKLMRSASKIEAVVH